MNTITEKTSKDEIISSAVELTDSLSQQVDSLHQQRQILFTTLAMVLVYNLLF